MAESEQALQVDAGPDIEEEILSEKGKGEEVYVAPPWKLMWWRFRKHKMALICTGVLIILYFIALCCEFVAPYDPNQASIQFKQVPPTAIHIRDAEGQFHWPFIYQHDRAMDPESFVITYVEDTTIRYPIRLLVRGFEYKWLGRWKSDLHLFGLHSDAADKQGLFLLGTDRLGRDMFSRIILGSQISLTIGLVGVLMSLVFGTTLGIISGYYGGIVDDLMQRFSEVIMSMPQIPLWMALAAVVPLSWSGLRVYFGITIILSLINWGGLARQLRGRTLALREEGFTLAAHAAGASDWWIIRRHLVPNNMSHIIVVATLAIPGMILGETSLSYLGLGIRPPMTSWGVLLQEAQNVRTIVFNPWLIIPAVLVILVVLGFNFLGDGLRDAVSPFSK